MFIVSYLRYLGNQKNMELARHQIGMQEVASQNFVLQGWGLLVVLRMRYARPFCSTRALLQTLFQHQAMLVGQNHCSAVIECVCV